MHEVEQNRKVPNVCVIAGISQAEKRKRINKDEERNK